MITAIILAAGFSRRFGKEKLLMKINKKPMISYVIDVVISSGFDEVILVYQNEAIRRIVNREDIIFAYNKESVQGMSTSVKCGIQKASKTDAYMFINGDQPFITIEVIHSLMDTFYKRKESIIVPKYNEKRGNPVIFSSQWKEQFLSVTGDKGGRNIIKNNPEEVFFIDIANNHCGMDMDTWEDYISLKELLNDE